MVYSAKWITQKGKLTQENRDFCAVALCGNKAIYVVVDGSTKGSQSGVLACEYSKALADQFVINAGFDTAAQLSALVNALSDKFKTIYPEGRLSFLVLLDAGNAAFYAIHAGDCRLGQVGLGIKLNGLVDHIRLLMRWRIFQMNALQNTKVATLLREVSDQAEFAK